MTNGEVENWRTPPALWAKLKTVARQMRMDPTESEKLLWDRLRARRLGGYRFRRQHSIGQFVVDFYCAEAKLVVEVDGPIHKYRKEEDEIREVFIEFQGLRVLRFSDNEVLHDLEEVLRRISHVLNPRSSRQ